MIQQFQFWVFFQRKQRYQIKIIHVLYIHCASFKTVNKVKKENKIKKKQNMKKKKQPVNTWKQSKSPPIHKWTKKMHFTYTHTLTFIHIYNGVLFSQKKRNLAISDNKDGV